MAQSTKSSSSPTGALLIVFGPLDWLDHTNNRHHVSGIALFEDLTSRGVWFCSRRITVEPGTPMLLYLKRVGIVGHATITSTSATAETDTALLRRYSIEYLRTRISIRDVVATNPPIDLKPLIPRLAFIKNKGGHWGTALRTTPRYIGNADFKLILSRATRS